MRNRLKRMVRAFFRHRLHHLDTPLDIVVIAKKPATGLNSKQAFTLLGALFDQLTDRATRLC